MNDEVFYFFYFFLPLVAFFIMSRWLKGVKLIFRFSDCALLSFIADNSDDYLLEGGATSILLITASRVKLWP